MSRQPAHLSAVGEHSNPRQAIWSAIRKLAGKDKTGEFTNLDIEGESGVRNLDTIRTYVTGLTAGGYLQVSVNGTYTRDEKGLALRTKRKLVNDVGIDAPRVTRTGEPVTQGQSREQMWQTMRILTQFTAQDLAINASTPEVKVELSDAKSYIKFMVLARYLTVAQKGSGKRGAVYLFIKQSYTGPKAPQVQRINQVFDPNTGKVVWQPNPEALP